MDNGVGNKWGIIYCPRSGSFHPQRKWQKIDKCLRSRKIAFDMVQSENPSGVERLVTMMINNGYHTIIIVGGDSALNDAVNCLMQVDKSVRDQISLGVIPNGRTNDFAKFWKIRESDVDQTISWLQKHRTRRIDLGRIQYTNQKGERCHRYFLNSLNVGLVASVMNLRRKTRSLLGSQLLAFIPSSLLLIFQRLDYKMRIKINTDVINRRVMAVCIGNATGYGMTPNAVPYNGLLDVSVVYHPRVTQLVEGFYLLFSGKILNHRDVHPYRTREINFEKANRVPVSVDGRLINSPVAPYKVSVVQEVINFLVP